jgi:shikimate dehydrogenase
MMISGTTKLLGVIGDPVKHSLSPVMHNAALAELGADYVYVAFPIKAEQLKTAIAGFSTIGVQGFNVTIPHKQAIMPLLNEVSADVQAVGAVNTVWHTEQGWAGTNTDVTGFIAPLKSLRDWSGETAIVLGHGGAARAVVVGCTKLGFGKIQVFGRNHQKLDVFLQSWANSPLQPPLSVHEFDEIARIITDAALIVNTTPVGMPTTSAETPLDEGILSQAQASAVVYDLIYTPRPTHFLRLASQQGLTTIDGTEMLVQQGAAALEIWLNQPAPVDTMRQALLSRLSEKS